AATTDGLNLSCAAAFHPLPARAAARPAKGVPMPPERLFSSYFMAGFECSTHRRADGRRLDLVAATAHDRLAAADYRQVRDLGLTTARDGLRWHLIETA